MSDNEWAWGISDDGETWLAGGPTRDDAIERGKEEFDGRAFRIDTMTKIDFRRFIPDVDRLLEDAENVAYDESQCEEWTVSRTGPAAKDLAQLLSDWCDRHEKELNVNWYECDGHEETVGPFAVGGHHG